LNSLHDLNFIGRTGTIPVRLFYFGEPLRGADGLAEMRKSDRDLPLIPGSVERAVAEPAEVWAGYINTDFPAAGKTPLRTRGYGPRW